MVVAAEAAAASEEDLVDSPAVAAASVAVVLPAVGKLQYFNQDKLCCGISAAFLFQQ